MHAFPQAPALKPSTAGDTQPSSGGRVPLKICLLISSRSIAIETACRIRMSFQFSSLGVKYVGEVEVVCDDVVVGRGVVGVDPESDFVNVRRMLARIVCELGDHILG